MTGAAGPFRQPRPQDLSPRHAALVDAIRALIEQANVPLDELGAAVRTRLAATKPEHRLARTVPRPGQRMSALADGSRFPDVDELDAIVALCTGGSPAHQEHLRRLRVTADRERVAARTAGRTAGAAAAGPRSDGAAPALAAGARVGDPRDWTRLGVHQPIGWLADGTDLIDRVRKGHLPSYVLREADRRLLRPALQAAAAREHPPVRRVVIFGESSAGKTRMAAEAARAELPQWWLVVPRTAADVVALGAELGSVGPVVVWLDEVQELLVQPGATEALQKLLDAPIGPVVLLATVRTDAERALTGSAAGRLLDRAEHRIELSRRPHHPQELQRELDRAAQYAAEGDDPWLREALAKIGDQYGIAEWLAAGPQLLRELGRARTSSDPVERMAAALVDAAVDCYRAGYTSPVPEPLLRAAHPLYLANLDEANPVLVDVALHWARRRVAGAVGLLIHHGARGDQAFDYLLGHAGRADAGAIDQRLWPLLLQHITPRTFSSIGVAAYRHRHSGISRQLLSRRLDFDLLALCDGDKLQRLADAGDVKAAVRFAELLVERGDEATLIQRADDGDVAAASRLADLLAERGDETTLIQRADDGDVAAPSRLADLLAERGDTVRLTQRADDGDVAAASRLADLLAERGDTVRLTQRADDGDEDAARRLAGLLVERGDETTLAQRADGGDRVAASELARLLGERDDVVMLIQRADGGDWAAASELATLLVRQGDVVALARRADANDGEAAYELARLLGEQGDVATLVRRAAADRLAGLLGERSYETTLTWRADAGDGAAASWLADLLAERGDEATLIKRADDGDLYAASRLADLLVRRGDEATLEQRARAGDGAAAYGLVDLLAERGDEASLAQRADAGDQYASGHLARLLVDRGEVDMLAQRADAGDQCAAYQLTEVLAGRARASNLG